MTCIKEHIPVNGYQSFVANNNIKLKYQRLLFYEFKLVMNQIEIKIESTYLITQVSLSLNENTVIPPLDD